jgi:hypothetical protein
MSDLIEREAALAVAPGCKGGCLHDSCGGIREYRWAIRTLPAIPDRAPLKGREEIAGVIRQMFVEHVAGLRERSFPDVCADAIIARGIAATTLDHGDYVDIVFDGPPSHEAGRFVEVENAKGASINFGEWIERPDGYWALRIEKAPTTLDEAGVFRVAKALQPMIESGSYDARALVREYHGIGEGV